EHKRIDARYWRFATGAGAVTVLLVSAALISFGPQAFQESWVNLRLHASPESYSSHRVGLGDALLYRGEQSRKEMAVYGGIEGKREQLAELMPWLKLVGLLAIIWVCVISWKTRAPPHRLIWLGIYPLFCLTNPQINYYNLRLLPLLYHLEKPNSYRHRLGLYLLFGIEAATQLVMITGATRYAVTATTSIGLAVYLAIMAAFLSRDLWHKPAAG
ncbi:MAG: hypothetical protein ACPHER_08275, partial [Nevskiales bacterium]